MSAKKYLESCFPRKRKVRKNSEEYVPTVVEETLRSPPEMQDEELSPSSSGVDTPSCSDFGSIMKSEMSDVIKGTVLGDELTAFAHNAVQTTENAVRKMIEAGWSVRPLDHLPTWLQDNDCLLFGHRPPLPSFNACFKSIFRIHTETGNIWTHLIGCVIFIGLAIHFHLRPHIEDAQHQDRIVIGLYFLGATICLCLSTLFHILNCHSEFVGNLFLKLDYCGVVIHVTGSYIPWLHFVFYCHHQKRLLYITSFCTLGLTTIIVTLWDKFSEPSWRPLRAGVFMAFGFSGLIPLLHFGFIQGWSDEFYQNTAFWWIFAGGTYIVGTLLYANRIPERIFPGKFDIWLHSHQIFHIHVLVGALLHYYGIYLLAFNRLMIETCDSVFS